MNKILTRVTNEHIKPIPRTEPIDQRPVLGYNLFPEIFANILIFAKKNSGKTTVIYKIMEKCITNKTTVYAFVSTLYNDDGWKSIRKYCKTKGIEFHGYTSLVVDGVNKLDELVMELEMEARVRELEKEMGKKKKKVDIILCDDEEEEEPKERKSKFQIPEKLIILDDMSKMSRNKSVAQLLKQNRHYKAKVIISSQSVKDCVPDARFNADYWLLFRGITDGAIDEVWEKTQLPVKKEVFHAAYKLAMMPTKENPKPFLYIDTNMQTMRKSFVDNINLKMLSEIVSSNSINAKKETDSEGR